MRKEKNIKPSIKTGFVGPELDDSAPSILKNEEKKTESKNNQGHKGRYKKEGAFTSTPPPNYQAPSGPFEYSGQDRYGGQSAMPYYMYQHKSGGWWKGLLIFVIIVAVLVFLGISIGMFFSNLTNTGYNDFNDIVDLPDDDYIARLAVEGEITATTDDSYLATENTYNHKFTLDALDNLMYDSNNRGILLYVDTPGGGVYESDELYLKIKEYKEKTHNPVYVAMGSIAASGGYYISAPADKILANRNCWTGSIGVTMGTHFDISEFLTKHGIKAENITSGENKAMGSLVEPITDEQRKIYKSLIDDAYEQFVGIIAEGRKMSIQEVKKIGDGRIYTANQAVNNGLIDGIATEEEATQMLKKDNNLLESEVIPIMSPSKTSWLDNFLQSSINPIFEKIGSFGKGDLETALDLTDNNNDQPLKYLYES